MWFLGSKKKYTEVVSLQPPLVGTFQQHCKVLKKLLPDLTKEEVLFAKDSWTRNMLITFLSPLPSSKITQLADKLDEEGWIATYRGPANEARCGCDSFYNETCCSGIPLGIYHPDVYELSLPDTLFTRGSLMEEMTSNKRVELTEEELGYLQAQGAELSRQTLRSLKELILNVR